MRNKCFRRYWILSLLGVLVASFYPLYMGIRVVSDMIRNGTVLAEDYPKYIIPYTPICLALLAGVVLLPLLVRYAGKLALPVASVISSAMFFTSELLLESKVIVTSYVQSSLESWQMYMCYVSPEIFETRTWKPVDVLIGEYSPAFKLHFYLISIVIILSLLNCFYGFGDLILSGNKKRLKPLVLQSVSSVVFVSMCVWACFTAFYRTGDVTVSAVSAVLMAVFFIVLGMTVGIYAGSFTLEKNKFLSVVLPGIVASAVTGLMYAGELILLSGNLYRFGSGFFFSGLPLIVLSPADIVIVLLSGLLTSVIFDAVCERESKNSPET